MKYPLMKYPPMKYPLTVTEEITFQREAQKERVKKSEEIRIIRNYPHGQGFAYEGLKIKREEIQDLIKKLGDFK